MQSQLFNNREQSIQWLRTLLFQIDEKARLQKKIGEASVKPHLVPQATTKEELANKKRHKKKENLEKAYQSKLKKLEALGKSLPKRTVVVPVFATILYVIFCLLTPYGQWYGGLAVDAILQLAIVLFVAIESPVAALVAGGLEVAIVIFVDFWGWRLPVFGVFQLSIIVLDILWLLIAPVVLDKKTKAVTKKYDAEKAAADAEYEAEKAKYAEEDKKTRANNAKPVAEAEKQAKKLRS